MHRLYLTSARQGPAWLLSSASTSKNPRYGTGGAGMNHQDRRGRRSTLHRTPAATQHDAEEEEDDDEVWAARLPTSTRRDTQLPAQQGTKTQQPPKRVVKMYDPPTKN